MRKNPNFDYKEFERKRRRMVNALRALDDDVDDSEALSDLQTAFHDNQNTIDFLKYMTPFYPEILKERLISMGNIYESNCELVLEELLGIKFDNQEDRLFEWVFDKVKELSESIGDFIFQALSKLRLEYLKQNPQLDPKDVFEFTKSSLSQLGSVPIVADAEFNNSPITFQALGLDIEIDQIGYIGLVFLWLNSAGLDQPNIWLLNRNIFVKFDLNIGDSQSYSLWSDREYILETLNNNNAPFWLHSSAYDCDFYTTDIHFTSFGVEDVFSVTPASIRTKTKDYKKSPLATYRRNIELVTAAQAPRSLLFAWSERNLCLQGARGHMHLNLYDMMSYGENCIYVFARANISIYKHADQDLQTVVLLNSIEETIPCRIDFYNSHYVAFLGANNREPLLVMDDSSHTYETPFACHVLKALRAFLKSRDYRITDNLNSVPQIPFERIRELTKEKE